MCQSPYLEDSPPTPSSLCPFTFQLHYQFFREDFPGPPIIPVIMLSECPVPLLHYAYRHFSFTFVWFFVFFYYQIISSMRSGTRLFFFLLLCLWYLEQGLSHNKWLNKYLNRLPRWLSGKDSAGQFRRCKRRGFDSWVRKILWREKCQPTPVFLPGEIPWTEEPGGLQSMGSKKSWTRLSE